MSIDTPKRDTDASRTAAISHEADACWVAVDGYHFDSEYQKALKDCGLRVLWIDDHGHAEHYVADLVLNQNIYANAALYPSREPYTRLLLGTRYVLLRREFWRWRGWQRRVTPVARRVLVTLGGVDIDNVTHRVVDALHRLPMDRIEAVVVMGGGVLHGSDSGNAADTAAVSVDVRQSVRDMPSLMAWADVAVAAAGSTVWELAFMGLPAAIIALAENQLRAASELTDQGYFLSLGEDRGVSPYAIAGVVRTLLEDFEARQAMALRGPQLVSGFGPHEVVRHLVQVNAGG